MRPCGRPPGPRWQPPGRPAGRQPAAKMAVGDDGLVMVHFPDRMSASALPAPPRKEEGGSDFAAPSRRAAPEPAGEGEPGSEGPGAAAAERPGRARPAPGRRLTGGSAGPGPRDPAGRAAAAAGKRGRAGAGRLSRCAGWRGGSCGSGAGRGECGAGGFLPAVGAFRKKRRRQAGRLPGPGRARLREPWPRVAAV